MILSRCQMCLIADLIASSCSENRGSHGSRRRCLIGKALCFQLLLARAAPDIRSIGSSRRDIEDFRHILAGKNRTGSCRDTSMVQVEDCAQVQDRKRAVDHSEASFPVAESPAQRSGRSYSNQTDQMVLFRRHYPVLEEFHCV